MKLTLTSIFLAASICVYAQTKVLFLGNSYTNYNDLPMLVSSLADNGGQEIFVDSNTPGGYTFEGHSTNATSQSKIEEGEWDYVILQEQSQLPSFPEGQFMTSSFAFAETINETILEHNPCAETMFYMTWGREEGDAGNCAGWPPVCTYEGMDDLLAERYQLMAEELDGVVSPVGKVWRYLRENSPEIGLYAGDGSHPSLNGSYAAAVTFYTSIFRADPAELTDDLGVDPATAETIRMAVQEVVFNDFSAHLIGEYDVEAAFEVEILSGESAMNFINLSENADDYTWVINGQEYTTEGVYLELLGGADSATVTLTASNACEEDSTEEMSFDFINSLEEYEDDCGTLYPNPSSGYIEFGEIITHLTLTNSEGKVIKTYSEGLTRISTLEFENGAYTGFFCVQRNKKN